MHRSPRVSGTSEHLLVIEGSDSSTEDQESLLGDHCVEAGPPEASGCWGRLGSYMPPSVKKHLPEGIKRCFGLTEEEELECNTFTEYTEEDFKNMMHDPSCLHHHPESGIPFRTTSLEEKERIGRILTGLHEAKPEEVTKLQRLCQEEGWCLVLSSSVPSLYKNRTGSNTGGLFCLLVPSSGLHKHQQCLQLLQWLQEGQSNPEEAGPSRNREGEEDIFYAARARLSSSSSDDMS